MELVVFGDSNSYGSEAVKDFDYSSKYNIYFAYGGWLSRLNNWRYRNFAKPGASNIEIITSLFNFFEKESPDLNNTIFIIGWSEAGRIDVGKRQNEPLVITPYLASMFLLDHNAPEGLKPILNNLKSVDPLKEFCKVYLDRIITSKDILISDLLNRLAVDLYLTKLNARYLTFPTLRFKLADNSKLLSKLLNLKNNILDSQIVTDLDNNEVHFKFIDMFKNYGLAGGGHLKGSAHSKVAKWLDRELKVRNI